MFITASSAVHDLGWSILGSSGFTLREVLSSAEVESSMGLEGWAFGSGFGPGSERFCQVRAHPGPRTGPTVRFSPNPEPRTELRSGSGRFGSGPKFRTEPRQP
jgi:hypothetical protein